MSQYKTGTVTVDTGSATVIGIGTAWLSNVDVGDGFTIAESSVAYDVAAVISDTELQLSVPYAGPDHVEKAYAIFRDFTTVDNLPEMSQGDLETATIFTRAMRTIDGKLAGSTLTAGQLKTLYESNSNTNAYTDAEKTKLAGLTSGGSGGGGGEVTMPGWTQVYSGSTAAWMPTAPTKGRYTVVGVSTSGGDNIVCTIDIPFDVAVDGSEATYNKIGGAAYFSGTKLVVANFYMTNGLSLVSADLANAGVRDDYNVTQVFKQEIGDGTTDPGGGGGSYDNSSDAILKIVGVSFDNSGSLQQIGGEADNFVMTVLPNGKVIVLASDGTWEQDDGTGDQLYSCAAYLLTYPTSGRSFDVDTDVERILTFPYFEKNVAGMFGHGILAVGNTVYCALSQCTGSWKQYYAIKLFKSPDAGVTWYLVKADGTEVNVTTNNAAALSTAAGEYFFYQGNAASGSTINDGTSSFTYYPFTIMSFLQDGNAFDHGLTRSPYIYAYSPEADESHKINMARVRFDEITDITKWEYFTGYDGSDNPTWSPNINLRQPFLTIPSSDGTYNARWYSGRASVVYKPALGKYVLAVGCMWGTRYNAINAAPSSGSLWIGSSDQPYGPFEEHSYTPNFDLGITDSLTYLPEIDPRNYQNDASQLNLVISDHGNNFQVTNYTWNQVLIGLDAQALDYVPSTVLRSVAQYNEINRGFDSTNGSGNARFYVARIPFRIGSGSVSKLVLSFSNCYLSSSSTGNMSGPGNSLPISMVSIEINGVVESVTFGGSRSRTLANLESDVHADDLLPADFGLARFVVDEEVWVKMQITHPASVQGYTPQSVRKAADVPGTQFLNHSNTGDVSTVDEAGPFTINTPANVTTQLVGYSPLLLGTFESAETVVIARGDSITAGDGDLEASTSGRGWFNRMTSLFTTKLATLNLSAPGVKSIAGTTDTRLSDLYQYGTDAVIFLGTNDFGTSGTDTAVATVKTNIQSIISAMRAEGVDKVGVAKLLARTSSTDDWATEANQTILAGWVDGARPDQLNDDMSTFGADFVIANDIVRGTNAFKWKTNNNANGFTTDGTHPSRGGHDAIAAIAAQTLATQLGLTYNGNGDTAGGGPSGPETTTESFAGATAGGGTATSAEYPNLTFLGAPFVEFAGAIRPDPSIDTGEGAMARFNTAAPTTGKLSALATLEGSSSSAFSVRGPAIFDAAGNGYAVRVTGTSASVIEVEGSMVYGSGSLAGTGNTGLSLGSYTDGTVFRIDYYPETGEFEFFKGATSTTVIYSGTSLFTGLTAGIFEPAQTGRDSGFYQIQQIVTP